MLLNANFFFFQNNFKPLDQNSGNIFYSIFIQSYLVLLYDQWFGISEM